MEISNKLHIKIKLLTTMRHVIYFSSTTPCCSPLKQDFCPLGSSFILCIKLRNRLHMLLQLNKVYVISNK